MILKMKLISLTGPVEDLDRVVDQYLSKYDIDLENALTELSGGSTHLVPFKESNPYKEPLSRIQEYAGLLSEKGNVKPANVDAKAAIDLAGRLDETLNELKKEKSALLKQTDELKERIDTLTPFKSLPENLSDLMKYHFVDFRFGRIPKDFYEKFRNYVYSNFDTIFYPCQKDDQYIWGVYYAPSSEVHKIDAVYTSMHFERIHIPDEDTNGTPKEMIDSLSDQKKKVEDQIHEVDRKISEILDKDAAEILGAKQVLEIKDQNFDVRKMAAILETKSESYYIICGWMAEGDVKKFQKEIAQDDRAVCMVEDLDKTDKTVEPPTKLKNPKIFKPYEMYVEMYGLPNYRELDPTIFVALTYSFIFGAMFGDFGQGLCLLIGGLLLYKFKHVTLAGIIASAGVFSSIFGLLFGSFFGFENVIPALWLRPKDATMKLPGIGSINTVLVVAIVFGMFLIIATMILNIINAKRLGDKENLYFGTNSLVGLIFYTGVVIFIFHAFMTGKTSMGALFIIIFFVIPLVVMFCKEPLTEKAEKKKVTLEGGPVMFVVENFFEMFEVLLSFFSNTLSFVRVGAFAVSHAAMMEVVLMLAGATKGNPNWVVIVLGNLFVMGMEGLIVGIQVLRLEYYEMFSRFYKGDGKPFKSFFKHKVKKA